MLRGFAEGDMTKQQVAVEVGSKIREICRRYGERTEFNVLNNSNAVEIISMYGTRFWIRLIEFNGAVKVDINVAQLRPELRRKGVLTTILKELSRLKSIDSLVISSVCTKEMYEFCLSRGLKENLALGCWVVK